MTISATIKACLLLLLLLSHFHYSLQWSLPKEIRGIHSNLLNDDKKTQLLQQFQKTAGDGMTVVGFLQSTHESLVANPNSIQKILGGIDSLNEYLQDSGIARQEITPILNARLADNLAILSVLQKTALNGKDRRDLLLSDMNMNELTSRFTLEEAARYVKYAVAAYGDAVIQAANMDLQGEIDLRQGDWTKARVSEHICIPEKDLVLMDVKYSGNATQLRHFIAVDHTHKKVVLAIRGTFCASEAAVDLVGYTRPFCGGEAHAGMSIMTERLWDLVADDVLQALDENDGYELIITGHSLGAGTALLLNILLHQDDQIKNRQIRFRAFAYASPPVYTPVSRVPQALQTAVNYIHDMDDVPFLSGDSIRHEVATLRAIDADCKDMELVEKAKLILGTEEPSESLMEHAHDAFCKKLPAKQGMPEQVVPAMAISWACEQGMAGKFDLKLCDPVLLAKSGIYIDAESVLAHYPTRYEWAFTNVEM